MLDAWIIDFLKRKEQEKRDSEEEQRPFLEIPKPSDDLSIPLDKDKEKTIVLEL